LWLVGFIRLTINGGRMAIVHEKAKSAGDKIWKNLISLPTPMVNGETTRQLRKKPLSPNTT
jgi:hypothetical protein